MNLAFMASLLLAHYAPPPPQHNLSPHPNFNQSCAEFGLKSHACLVDTVEAVDTARRQEGLGRVYLPRDWKKLTPADQLFVITDLERTARGEHPIAGLTAALDRVAAQGAVHRTDPTLSSAEAPAVSIWAEGVGPVASDYGWMYDDGWSGLLQKTSNLACTSATAPGCWGHRDNILAEWSRRLLANRPGTWYLVAGAAQAPVAGSAAFPGGRRLTEESDAMIVTAVSQPPPYVYTWSQAVAAGAGSPTKGWNPVAEAPIVQNTVAWALAHLWKLLAGAGAMILLFLARGRRKQRSGRRRRRGKAQPISRYRR